MNLNQKVLILRKTYYKIRYLLRITPTSHYETEKFLFALLEKAAALDIPMCLPVEFGTCDDGLYSIHSWIDGEDLKYVLPRLTETEQYVLGLKAGEVLRKIHSIPLQETHIDYWTAMPLNEDWAARFNRQLDNAINNHHFKWWYEAPYKGTKVQASSIS